jgi:hypothetical protein
MTRLWVAFCWLGAAAGAVGCGSSDTGGAHADAGATPDDGSNSCPADQPMDGTPCSGSTACGYGHSTCCGIDYSFMTCKCQKGGYSCSMTVECNFVCPDASSADAR